MCGNLYNEHVCPHELKRSGCNNLPRAACQANMAAAAAAPEAFDAIHAEFQAADGLVALPGDARRCHVHYTHCRTDNPDHVQREGAPLCLSTSAAPRCAQPQRLCDAR
jgi:hypothetical protein